ncbi:MAG: hypothetical protein HY365_03120 [Candidatus Aenigmarchaeota archaeon]|nr:hypothetical protein [Candidatus Aenigmarchaeota archaeon]
MNYLSKAGKFAGRIAKPTAYTAGALSASALVWALTKEHSDNYLASIAPMVPLALAGGEAARQRFGGATKTGQAFAYLAGAAAGGLGYDLWETMNSVPGAENVIGHVAGQQNLNDFPSKYRMDGYKVAMALTLLRDPQGVWEMVKNGAKSAKHLLKYTKDCDDEPPKGRLQ